MVDIINVMKNVKNLFEKKIRFFKGEDNQLLDNNNIMGENNNINNNLQREEKNMI